MECALMIGLIALLAIVYIDKRKPNRNTLKEELKDFELIIDYMLSKKKLNQVENNILQKTQRSYNRIYKQLYGVLPSD